MRSTLYNMTLHVVLTDGGDALLWGELDGMELPPDRFRDRLFAWHEPSCYGTMLELQQAGDLTVTVLPAEMVLPFFAEPSWMEIYHWECGDEDAGRLLLAAAPQMMAEARAGRYVPSYEAYRGGKLEWATQADSEALAALDPELLHRLGLASGLQAAFSAAVTSLHYADETSLSELRRDYPELFRPRETAVPVSADVAPGLSAAEWLVAIGWSPDTAPFRPALQLLEPDEESDDWQLRLIVQDKLDNASIAPVRLSASGEAAGEWPEEWSPFIRERAPGWTARLIAALELVPAGGGGDLFPALLDDETAWRFLTDKSCALLDDGWEVLLPGWWEAASKRKPRLRAHVAPEVGAGGRGESLFGLSAIVEFDWRIAIGELDLGEAEFAELLERKQRLIRFRGQWVCLDPALLEQIKKMMDGMSKEDGLTLQDALQLHLLQQSERELTSRAGTPAQAGATEAAAEADADEDRVKLEIELNSHLLTMIRQLGKPSDIALLDVPAALHANLRSYQREGYTWLSFLRTFGLGACLADDMGLGKTIQYIAYLLRHKESSATPALLVCPTSVLGNWQKELARFAPDLRVLLHYGKSRPDRAALRDVLHETDIVLTSYTTALLDQDVLQEIVWSSLCLDEAQNIKNAQNKQTAAIRSFQAEHRIALTGTPIENRLSELWSIYDFLNPGYLGSQRGFQHRFATPIEKHHDVERTAQLQQLVKPFMLRRKKNDPVIQLDLPEKQEMKVYIGLTPEQGALYEQTVKDLLERMKHLEGIERKGAILGALTRLKQLCDHPDLLTKDAELSQELLLSEQRREAFISRSAKLERIVAMVDELRDEGDSCLIFTQYVGMGRLLTGILQAHRGEPVLYLNGSTPKLERDRMIETFQSEDGPGIFVLSLKAGGVGLNLTAANHVFHFDRWWNPAVENQATDRAYRMGQKRNVQVHKFISHGTLEERIDDMLESKMSLSENVISTSENWITELSNEELHDLFALRQSW